MTGDLFSTKISQGNFLIQFYTPWSDDCKALTPVYEQLATTYKGNDKVTVAKVSTVIKFLDR